MKRRRKEWSRCVGGKAAPSLSLRIFRGAFDMGKLSAVFVSISLTLLPLQSCRGGNPVYDELMRRGVPISAREVVRLPVPTLTDGLTAEQQRHAVEGIADGHTWEELTRRSVVAPFVFK